MSFRMKKHNKQRRISKKIKYRKFWEKELRDILSGIQKLLELHEGEE